VSTARLATGKVPPDLLRRLVLPVLLLPAGATAADLDALTAEIDAAAWELGVWVLGGHTEVAPGIRAPLVVMAAVGRARPEGLITAAGARPGDALVLTKAAALEGTSILARDFAERPRRRQHTPHARPSRRPGSRARTLDRSRVHLSPTEGDVAGNAAPQRSPGGRMPTRRHLTGRTSGGSRSRSTTARCRSA
jgi:hypothetical protein